MRERNLTQPWRYTPNKVPVNYKRMAIIMGGVLVALLTLALLIIGMIRADQSVEAVDFLPGTGETR